MGRVAGNEDLDRHTYQGIQGAGQELTVWMGFQRMEADSCGLVVSSPGGCKIEMHTSPFG